MENQQAEEMISLFKESQNSAVFEKLWAGTVNMADPYKYYDPTGARTVDDFLQVTRIALFKAINTFVPGRGATALSWIRNLMVQALIKELKRCTRSGFSSKISWDGYSDDSKTHSYNCIEALVYEQLARNDSYQQSSYSWSEQLYWVIVADVLNRVSGNLAIERAFSLKLVFPRISRKIMAKMLKTTKPTISNYFKIIRSNIALATEQYATT